MAGLERVLDAVVEFGETEESVEGGGGKAAVGTGCTAEWGRGGS